MLGNNYEKFTPEWVPVEGACSKCGAPILRNTVVVLQTPTGDKYWVKCSSTKCAHMEKHPPEAPIEEPPKQELLLEESPAVTKAVVLPIEKLPTEVAPIEPTPEVELIKEVTPKATSTKVEPTKDAPTKETTQQDAPIEVISEGNSTVTLVNAPIKKPTNKKGTAK